jgi:hypothetical protein
MNKNIVYLFVFLFTLFFIAGCSFSTAVPYSSFAENENENGTATITFIGKKKQGVDLFYFEEKELPIPIRKKYWAPVTFPAGRPFTLTVNIYYYEMQGKGTVVKFNCPALTSGENYKLSVNIIEEKKSFSRITREGSETLVLSDAKTDKVVYEQKVR